MDELNERPARRHGLWIWTCALLLPAIAAFAWWTRGYGSVTAPNGRPAPPAREVVAATARKGDIDVTLDELGTVMSLATVTVQTQISGQLMQVAFHEGQSVKQGDFLAQIDPRPFQATLEQDEGQLMHDEAA